MSDPSFSVNERPQLANWLWHRWYAKLYWLAFSLFWMAFVAAWLLSFGSDFFRSVSGAYAMFFFNPITALVVLGAGYIRALFSEGSLEWIDPAEVTYPWPKSVSGTNDPYSDSADPRSPNWIGSPRNLAQRAGRDWP